MNSAINVSEIEVETSLGVTVSFDKDLGWIGCSYPHGWVNEETENEEFPTGESIDQAVLVGRKEGAIAEAKERILRELGYDDTEDVSFDEVTPEIEMTGNIQ